MAAPPPALAESLRDRYRLERELGRGGMATVWLAVDLLHERPVALKVLLPELAGAVGVDRFIREIRLTARLQHPNIVPVLDSGAVTGPDGAALPWYAMAYIPGESLRARLDREPYLPVDEALRIAEEAASALAAAHRQGIVHRDIKPGNLLLADGHVYVADFGIARAVLDTTGARLTSTGLALGTPAYMSPEQAAAQPVDARTDQYSLACVLYEMLAGEAPFTGPTAQAILARRLAEPPRAIRPVRPAVPPPRRLLRAAAGAVLVALVAGAGWLAARRPAVAKVDRDPDVVALYRQGLREFGRRTPEGTAEAVKAFSAAVRRDSTYADAWAAMTRTYVRAYGRRFVFPGVARDSVLRLAVASVNRALALDRRNADAWLTQAQVSRGLDPTDLAPATRALREALALDSANSSAWLWLAIGLAESGDMDTALAAWRSSVAADPSNAEALAFLALGHYWRRQYDSAQRWADSAVRLEPTYLLGRTAAAAVAVERGDLVRARAAFEAARRLSTEVEVLNATAGLAWAEARAGATGEAWRNLRQAYAALGDADRAIGWLRRYSPLQDLHFQLHLRCEPPLDPIANDPRFRALLMAPRPAAPGGC